MATALHPYHRPKGMEAPKFSKEITTGLRSPANIIVNESVDKKTTLTEGNSKGAVDSAEAIVTL